MFEIKREARQSLRPVYWVAFLVCLISFMLYGYNPSAFRAVPITLYNALQMFVFTDMPILQFVIIMLPLYIFLISPLSVGRARYFLHGVDGDWQLRHILFPFISRDYFRIVLVMGIRFLIISIAPTIAAVAFILGSAFAWNTWVLLCVITLIALIGFPIYYNHRLTAYLLAENSKMTFAESKRQNDLVNGYYKFKGLFLIDLSFFSWYIVGAFVFGIGQFFFMPYHETTMAVRYRELAFIANGKKHDSQHFDGALHSDKPQPTPQKPAQLSYYGLIVTLTLFAGLIFMTNENASAASDEIEIIVTTEQELRDAVEQNQSPIRIDTMIELTEGAIVIDDGQDITLRGTGSLVVALEDLDRNYGASNIRHFLIYGGRLTLQEELILTRDTRFDYGGGVVIGNPHRRYGHFIMEGGRIENNRTSGAGGGVAIKYGLFEMHGGVIHGNYTHFFGGGVDVNTSSFNQFSSRFLMTGGEISGNRARSSGGGVALMIGSHFAMQGGQITGNTAGGSGGGVHLWILTTFSMTGGEISYNHTNGFGGAVGVLFAHYGFEQVSIGPEAQFHGNTAGGRRSGDDSNPSPHRTFGLHAGLSQYPQIHWQDENSRPGTHLINNYDISFGGSTRPAPWQVHLALVGAILVIKGIAFIISVHKEKKDRSEQEDALCDA